MSGQSAEDGGDAHRRLPEADFAGTDAVLDQERLEEEDRADAADRHDADEEDRVAYSSLPPHNLSALPQDVRVRQMNDGPLAARRLAEGQRRQRGQAGDRSAEHDRERQAGSVGQRRADESARHGGRDLQEDDAQPERDVDQGDLRLTESSLFLQVDDPDRPPELEVEEEVVEVVAADVGLHRVLHGAAARAYQTLTPDRGSDPLPVRGRGLKVGAYPSAARRPSLPCAGEG